MKSRFVVVLLLAATAVARQAADDPGKPATRVYAFKAFLDGKPIGEHRFTVATDGGNRKVASEADFVVKFFGFNVYRYHHRADEQWTGECLSGLTSSTDDNGKPVSVRLVKTGEANEITTGAGRASEPGCLMTYAYWNPALRNQKRLLNPQTGKVDAVKVEHVGGGRIPVGGGDVAATDWRISGGESPIDFWISDQGDWVGLDSRVGSGTHTLSYRLP